MDSPIHTNYIQSGGATTLIFIVDEATPPFLSSYAQDHLDCGCATCQHDIGVPPIVDVSVTLHEHLQKKKECCESHWLLYHRNLAGAILRHNGNVQRRSDDVSVWENVGLLLVNFRGEFELSVVI